MEERNDKASDLRMYLGEAQRVQARDHGQAKWVEENYGSPLYAQYSEDGGWIECIVHVPFTIDQYQERRNRIRVELLRRRYVMDGWVRTVIEVEKGARNVRLHLSAPCETLTIETERFSEIFPEVNPGETIEAAIHRFARYGAVVYPTAWERVTVLPPSIRRILQRVPDIPPALSAASPSSDEAEPSSRADGNSE